VQLFEVYPEKVKRKRKREILILNLGNEEINLTNF
jgi:hypothetical protein